MNDLWDQCRASIGDDRLFWTAGISLAHTLTYVTCTLFFWLIVPLIPGSDNWKIDHGAAPPSPTLVRTTILHNVGSHVLVNPFFAFLLYDFAVNTCGCAVGAGSGLPSVSTVLLQVVVCLLIEDCGFYWLHRSLHHRFIYRHLHKVHHEYKANIGVAAEHFHPLEDVLNIVPTIAGPLLLGVHLLTFQVWLVVRISEIVNSHSGYVVPFSPWECIPLVQGGADRHEFHHSHNVGSYGSFSKFWDWVGGTDEAFNAFVASGRSKRGRGGGRAAAAVVAAKNM